jgi:hypothetical protein
MDQALKDVLKQQKHASGKKDEVDKRLAKKSKAFIEMWKDRFTLIAEAHKQKSTSHSANALRYMQKYLDLVSQYFEVPEEELKPSLFTEGDKDVAEIMLISLVYLDLAKAYSLSDQEKHQETAVRYLDQFVAFTSGFKFQYLNAKNLRKYIRRKEARRQDVTIFKNAYRRIALDSAACYIATFCYPPGHEVLSILRAWKQHLMPSRLGFCFVDYYYRWSPLLVQWAQQRPRRAKILKSLLRPMLTLFSKFLVRFFPAAVTKPSSQHHH